MRAPWSSRNRHDYLKDALTLLNEWTYEDHHITRTLVLDDSQHVALTERIKVAADALHLRPQIHRHDGCTRIRLGSPDNSAITEGEVALAARIEDAYRIVTSPEGT